ncbi:MAG: hypothetical protein PHZ09_06870 [Eubacteriales bacterium]|nr:hypothetical protein [Eubacteriales bacterium]
MKTFDEMRNLFEVANNSFLTEDVELIDSKVSERTLCGTLMSYIRDLIRNDPDYSGYFVDVEYNRNKGKVKTIIEKDLHVITINCDLILHSRGQHSEQDNLIAIEMKKSNRPKHEKTKDRNRLIALTKNSYDDIWSFDGKTLPEYVCRYVIGVYYEVDNDGREVLIEYYSEGKLMSSYSKKL